MKSLVVAGPNAYEVVERPTPRPGRGEVLVKAEYCAICASDFEILRGLNEEEVIYPITPGHEWSGRVVQGGDGGEHWIGKRVIADNAIPCRRCPACQRGRYHICTRKQEIGFSRDGGYAEYLLAPAGNLIELPDAVDDRTASLSEPLAVCLHALRRAGTTKNQKLLVIGDGPIGLLLSVLASHLGCRDLILAGHHQNRLDLVRSWTGAHVLNTHYVTLEGTVESLLDQRPELVFETTGHPDMVSRCFGLLERGATLCLVGTYRSDVALKANDVMLYEYSIVGSVSYDRAEMIEVVELLEDGLLENKQILTHTFPLESYAKAFEVVEHRLENVMKACFEMKGKLH